MVKVNPGSSFEKRPRDGHKPLGISSDSILKLLFSPSFYTYSRNIPFASLFYVILCFISYMYTKLQGQEGLITLITGKKLCPLILCTFLVILSIYIALGQGQTTHYGQNFDVNRKASSLWSFVASSKRISLIFDLIHIFNDLINVYSLMSGVDNPRGQNFDINRNLLSLRSFATSFKKNLFEGWYYTTIFMNFYMFIAPVQALGTKFWCQQENLVTSVICCKFQNNLFESLILYNFFFMILYMYIAPGQGQTVPRVQSFDVNTNVVSLNSFVASLKKNVFEDFIQLFFHDFIHVNTPGQVAYSSQGTNVNKNFMSLRSSVASFKS